MKIFYFLVQDLRCLVFSLIGMHFKVWWSEHAETYEGEPGSCDVA